MAQRFRLKDWLIMALVDGVIPLMINAYKKSAKFSVEGSETPQSIPSWFWILFVAFGLGGFFIPSQIFSL